MHTIETIREFKTRNFTVRVDAVEDNDLDLSWDDTGEVASKLDSGDLLAFGVIVKVYHRPTGIELGEDSLWNCIYESPKAFMDHRECGRQNRETLARDGRFQVYRKNRPYDSCLFPSDKLRKVGFATREKAEAWAKRYAREEFEIFETGRCGSYFSDMVREAIRQARLTASSLATGLRLRTV